MKNALFFLVLGIIVSEVLRHLGVPGFGDFLYWALGEPTLGKRIFVLILLAFVLFIYFWSFKKLTESKNIKKTQKL